MIIGLATPAFAGTSHNNGASAYVNDSICLCVVLPSAFFQPVSFTYVTLSKYLCTKPMLMFSSVLTESLVYINVSLSKLFSNTISPTLLMLRYFNLLSSTGSIGPEPSA